MFDFDTMDSYSERVGRTTTILVDGISDTIL